MEQQVEKKVRKNTTSCEVRNRWNAKHYDRVNAFLPKGYADILKGYCEDQGTTMNALLSQVIKFDLDSYKEKRKLEEKNEEIS